MWKFYPSATAPPAWVPPVVDEQAAARSHIESRLNVGVTNDASAGCRPEARSLRFRNREGSGWQALGEAADEVTENPVHLVAALTAEELMLLCEALDSHVYWQLSDRHYRNNGYVHEPGSDDAEAVAAIRAANALEEKLRAIEREVGAPT